MTYIFSIEGNIGSGKSTLVNLLEQTITTLADKPIVYVLEPVDVWTSIKDNNGKDILQKFYDDQHKYAFSFQMMAYISRLSLLKRTIRENPTAVIITERSIFTDKEVFVKMLYDEDKIEEVNYQIYMRWFDEFVNDIQIAGLIYVNTTPEKSKERVDIRSREGENIPLEYLQKCHDYHEKWITNLNKPVYVFNGNVDFKDNIGTKFVNSIEQFILTHTKLRNSPFKSFVQFSSNI